MSEFCYSCGDYTDIPGNFCSMCAGTWGPKAQAEMDRCRYEAEMKKQYEEDMLKAYEEDMRRIEILFREFSI